MKKRFTTTDYTLWTAIALFTGIIYSTLAIVSRVRKYLVETYGNGVFNHIYWVFGVIGVLLMWYAFRKYRGRALVTRLLTVAFFTGVYAYYLTGMKYPVERIHFLEYGLLGVLLFTALSRHFRNWTAVVLSLHAVYWIGLGDEAIQWALPGRVGEIRDSVINLFSGVLGIALYYGTLLSENRTRVSRKPARTVIAFTGISAVLTALFICTVHGFGHVIRLRDPGIVYSSFPYAELREINGGTGDLSPRTRAVYENEAVRHLFQREFYFTNDYKTSSGIVYRDYNGCLNEQRILEVCYGRFLREHSGKTTEKLIGAIDRDVAERVAGNPLVWPDSTRRFVEKNAGSSRWIYKSRVKSVIITGYTFRDLMFCTILILLFLGYLWWKVPQKESPRTSGRIQKS